MAPKKDKDKDKGKGKGKGRDETTSAFKTLYAKREPLPPAEAPNTTGATNAWKGTRNNVVLPLPPWDDEAVDTTEWKPNEVETQFACPLFAPRVLPKSCWKDSPFGGWRRAAVATDAVAGDETEPQVKPLPEILDEEPVVEDPKAKAKAKAEPKAKAKAKGAAAEEVDDKKTTAAQFAELELDYSHSHVVTLADFRTRELNLCVDEAAPPLTQMIAAQFAIIAEHRHCMPRGSFLWELIYPQDKDGMALFNPHGKYIVKLFIQGAWRQVLVDDVVPVGIAAPGSGAVHAPVLPSSSLPGTIWPQLLTKALLTAYQGDMQEKVLPVITALTGWIPLQLAYTKESLRAALTTRLFCVFQRSSEIDTETAWESEKEKPGKKGKKEVPEKEVPALNLPTSVPLVRLGGQPVDAALQFLVCEAVDDPPQVRVKAATWRPSAGKPRRTAFPKEFESEGDDEDEEEDHIQGRDEPERDDDYEPEDDDDEPDQRPPQRSPSGGLAVSDVAAAESGANASARSQGLEGNSATGEASNEAAKAAAETGAPADAAGGGEDTVEVPAESPWPQEPPKCLNLRSEINEHMDSLEGGYWIPEETLLAACPSYMVYLPPGDRLLSKCLDTTWSRDRGKPYVPAPIHVLKVKLVAEEQEVEQEPDEDEEPLAPPCHHVVVLYEPLRPDLHFGGGKEATAGQGGANLSCLLQCVNEWKPPTMASTPSVKKLAAGRRSLTAGGKEKEPRQSVDEPPHSIGLNVGESAASWTDAARSVMMPAGEHWYLVQDDAVRGGSVLSVNVEGSSLSFADSSVEFVELSTMLRDIGNPVAAFKPTEYPPQQGFSLWAKAEVSIEATVLPRVSQFVLLSHLSDPSLWPCLRVRLLRVAMDTAADAMQRCSRWAVTQLAASPLQSITSLPLDHDAERTGTVPPVPEGWTTKYVVMIEANVPMPAKAGNFKLELLLPPWEAVTKEVRRPAATPAEGADGAEAPAAPPVVLELMDVKANHVVRWGGETTDNSKRLVLRERIAIPMGNGDVLASLRVTVSGLPDAFLRASLVAQLPPTESMRPKPEEGAQLEAFVPGVPIDPKEYGGRFNWLNSCKPVATECGPGVVVFPHVVLCEGSTYRLEVSLDPFRGLDKLEGGSWLFEMHGSGEVEVGADTQEQDLEALVYKSFEEGPDAEKLPPRKERAAASRLKWQRQRGLLPEPTAEELAAEAEAAEAVAAAPAAKADPKAKGKLAAVTPDPAAEEQEAAASAAAEQERLAAALKRAELPHVNCNVADFIKVHTTDPPVLVSQDPWCVAPDIKPPGAPALDGPKVNEFGDVDNEWHAIARAAFGAAGLEEVREKSAAVSEAHWEDIRQHMASAKEANAQALLDLAQWRETRTAFEMKFLETRAELTGALKVRFEKRQVLKKELGDPEKADPVAIKKALEEAETAAVGIWDAELMDLAGQKVALLEAVPALQEALARRAAAPPPAEGEGEAAAEGAEAEELAALAEAVRAPARRLLKARVQLPPVLPFAEVLQQVEAILNPEAEPAEG